VIYTILVDNPVPIQENGAHPVEHAAPPSG